MRGPPPLAQTGFYFLDAAACVIAITARVAVAVTLVRVRTGSDDACAVVWVPRQPLCRGTFWRTFVSEAVLAGAQRRVVFFLCRSTRQARRPERGAFRAEPEKRPRRPFGPARTHSFR